MSQERNILFSETSVQLVVIEFGVSVPVGFQAGILALRLGVGDLELVLLLLHSGQILDGFDHAGNDLHSTWVDDTVVGAHAEGLTVGDHHLDVHELVRVVDHHNSGSDNFVEGTTENKLLFGFHDNTSFGVGVELVLFHGGSVVLLLKVNFLKKKKSQLV